MVSRIFKAGPGRVLALLFLLTVLILAVPEAQARNTDTATDSTEGDPGDGVLQPGPQVVTEPEITPKGSCYPILAVTLVDLGGGNFLPIFQMNNFLGTPGFIIPLHLRSAPSEGRWHRAP